MPKNFHIPHLPERPEKPRNSGLTMAMDKGMAIRQVEDFLSVAQEYVDIVKLGWSTSYLTPNLKQKIELYQNANIQVYLGGTLLEVFLVRKSYELFKNILKEFGIKTVEISTGSLQLSDEEVLRYIEDLAKDHTVLVEVGSKDPKKIIPPYKWVEKIKACLNAGAWKVITEARESGTVGVFLETGEIRSDLIDEILHYVSYEDLIFEAPKKKQQVWFIKKLGPNVNLGNIVPEEVIPLETLRLGLRGDTFNSFL